MTRQQCEEIKAWKMIIHELKTNYSGICVHLEHMRSADLISVDLYKLMMKRIYRTAFRKFKIHYYEGMGVPRFWEIDEVGAKKRQALCRQYINAIKRTQKGK